MFIIGLCALLLSGVDLTKGGTPIVNSEDDAKDKSYVGEWTLSMNQQLSMGWCDAFLCQKYCRMTFTYCKVLECYNVVRGNCVAGQIEVKPDEAAANGHWYAAQVWTCDCRMKRNADYWNFRAVSRQIETQVHTGSNGLTLARFGAVLPLVGCYQDKCVTWCMNKFNKYKTDKKCTYRGHVLETDECTNLGEPCGGTCANFSKWPSWMPDVVGQLYYITSQDTNHPETPGPGIIRNDATACICLHEEEGTAVVEETLATPAPAAAPASG